MEKNLHDAVFHSLEMASSENTTVTIMLSYHPRENSRVRVRGRVVIANVTSFCSTVDFARQAGHASFGNIADWSPSKKRGQTFFHLAGGTISVFGDAPVIEDVDEP